MQPCVRGAQPKRRAGLREVRTRSQEQSRDTPQMTALYQPQGQRGHQDSGSIRTAQDLVADGSGHWRPSTRLPTLVLGLQVGSDSCEGTRGQRGCLFSGFLVPFSFPFLRTGTLAVSLPPSNPRHRTCSKASVALVLGADGLGAPSFPHQPPSTEANPGER